MRVYSFTPLADERSRMLVLGSMPGVASLKAYQYYGNPRNYMWGVLYGVFEGREPDESYEDRLAFASRHGIAMWDVIYSCVREGSLDSNIRDAVPNDIPGLLRKFPGIGTLVCNGTKSFAELNKHYRGDPEVAKRDVLKLPSTSPIPTKHYRNLEDRIAAWRVLADIK